MTKQYILKKLLFLYLVTMTISPQFIPQFEKEQITSHPSLNLSDKIDTVLADERLDGAITGVSIRNSKTGELIYAHLGETRLRPASNMKILTSIAALETLGKDHRFSTEVSVDGTVENNVLNGNVYIKGYGDPTLLPEDLEYFAKELKAYGIHTIKGDIFGDDTWYDDVRLSQDLNWSDELNYTGAQVSALTLSPDSDYHTGTLIVQVRPSSEVGKKPEVILNPETDHVTINNQAKTVSTSEAKTLSIKREHGTNKIRIEGTIPVDTSPSSKWIAVWEPTNYVLDVFQKTLEKNGIHLTEDVKIQQRETPQEAIMVTKKESIPLSEILLPFMKMSNNGFGEVLTKEMGKVVYDEGSWDKGLQVIEEVMSTFGVDTETILLRDGSGMSHKNMIPANEFTQLLFQIQQQEWFPIFEKSLPVAGVDDRSIGGTLRNRMTDLQATESVKAKTGNLTSVSTLSGYVTTKNDEKLIFSILINNYLGDDVTSIEDALVKQLLEHE